MANEKRTARCSIRTVNKSPTLLNAGLAMRCPCSPMLLCKYLVNICLIVSPRRSHEQRNATLNGGVQIVKTSIRRQDVVSPVHCVLFPHILSNSSLLNVSKKYF